MANLIGIRFGRLVVQYLDHYNHRHVPYWGCLCDCGKQHVVSGTSLTRGYTKSCGCLHDEKSKERATKHGEAHTKLYYVWQSMIKRCEKEKDKSYVNYGARGISVCSEWRDYKKFALWARENGYNIGKSIDRIDNNGNYCPENCRWTNRKQQNNNTRRTIRITYLNQTKTLTEWCKELGLKKDTIYCRIRLYGWTPEKAFTTKIGG